MARFRVERVQRIVEDDVGNVDWGEWLDDILERLVQPPRSTRFRDPPLGSRWLWVVWDERPESSNNGYLIVFDPRRHEYGLATKPTRGSKGAFLGFYGETFHDAFVAM